MADSAGKLIVTRVGAQPRTVSLETPVLTIGRAPEAGLTLADALVSRHHAEVRVEAGAVLLTDLGSSNGTFVDGQRLLPHQPHQLRDGVRIGIGPFELLYDARAVTDQPAVDTASAGEAAPPAPPAGNEPVSGGAGGAEPRPAAGAESLAGVWPAEFPVVPSPDAAEQESAAQYVAVAVLPEPPKEQPRPTYPAPLAEGDASVYLRDLPVIYQDADFLGRFLHIFESIWEPLEQRQDHIEMYFDPRTCPAGFLPWLAGWLDLAFNAHWPEGRRRRLLSEAMDLYRWRGTRYGLTRMIEVCAGITPDITERPEQPFVFTITVTAPPGSGLDKDLIEELVRTHKPAWAGYRLEFPS